MIHYSIVWDTRRFNDGLRFIIAWFGIQDDLKMDSSMKMIKTLTTQFIIAWFGIQDNLRISNMIHDSMVWDTRQFKNGFQHDSL